MEFRRPDILEANRESRLDQTKLADEYLRDRLTETQQALDRICDYSRTLWGKLDEARHYLFDDVAGGEDGRTRAMLTSDSEWRAWVDLFAGVSSVLAGTTGDSGLGRSEATLVARSHGMEARNANARR
ncbi:MAG: hypothetical protein ABI232_10560 [Jatrophihabitantaceae bacterium]